MQSSKGYTFAHYYVNGNLKDSGEYDADGLPTGVWQYYSPDGHMTERRVYNSSSCQCQYSAPFTIDFQTNLDLPREIVKFLVESLSGRLDCIYALLYWIKCLYTSECGKEFFIGKTDKESYDSIVKKIEFILQKFPEDVVKKYQPIDTSVFNKPEVYKFIEVCVENPFSTCVKVMTDDISESDGYTKEIVMEFLNSFKESFLNAYLEFMGVDCSRIVDWYNKYGNTVLNIYKSFFNEKSQENPISNMFDMLNVKDSINVDTSKIAETLDTILGSESVESTDAERTTDVPTFRTIFDQLTKR